MAHMGLRLMGFKLFGGPDMVRAAADAAVKVIPAVTPTLTAAYVVYKLVNHDAFLDGVTDVFKGLGKCAIEKIQFGSLIIILSVEDDLTIKTIHSLHSDELLLQLVNRTVADYGTKYNDPQPKFTKIELMDHETCTLLMEKPNTLPLNCGQISTSMQSEGRTQSDSTGAIDEPTLTTSEPSKSMENNPPTVYNVHTGDYAKVILGSTVNEIHHHHQDRRQKYTIEAEEELAKELVKCLLAKAKVSVSSQPSLNMEKPLKPTRLKLSDSNLIKIEEDLTEKGHFTRREDMHCLYGGQAYLEVKSIKDLFDHAKESAENRGKSRYPVNSENYKIYIEKQGNLVGIVGQAGIGKTTFLETLLQKYLSEKNDSSLQEISFVFFISIRNLDFSTKKENLLHFLLHSILPDWEHSEESDQFLLRKISKDPKTQVTLDGLDEADVKDFKKKVGNVNMYKKASTWAFLVNLISGNLLPRARKIFTSRPNQLYSLHADHRPNFIREILGLDQAAQENLGQQICCEEKYPDVKKLVESNDKLKSMMYVPVNCIVTYLYLKQEKEELTSLTFTRVLAFRSRQFAKSNHTQPCQTSDWQKFATVAWDLFEKKQFVFPHNQLKEINEDIVSSHLFTSVTGSADTSKRVLEGQKMVYFPHLVMHEFYAAVNLVYVMQESEFTENLPFFQTQNRYEVVARFAFGLLNSSVVHELNPLYWISNDDLFKTKKVIMRDSIVQWIKVCGEAIDLKYLSWVYEAHDDDITKAVADVLKQRSELRFKGQFDPTDSSSLTYVLKEVPGSCIDMSLCQFEGGSFNRFAQLVAENKLQMEKLNLSYNEIGDNGGKSLACCVTNIKTLDLSFCNINDIKPLAESIRKMENKMSLNLRGNSIGNHGVKELRQSIENIDELDLSKCGITDISPLEGKIPELDKPMKKLNLSGNDLNRKFATDQVATLLQ